MHQNTWNVKVRFGETDAAGIVFYPNFYHWMDQASHELFRSMGLPTSEWFKEQTSCPIIESHAEFKSPAFFDDDLSIVTTVAEVRNKVFRLNHEFYRGDTLLAHGYEWRAWAHFAEGKPKAIVIPERLRDALTGDTTARMEK